MQANEWNVQMYAQIFDVSSMKNELFKDWIA